MTVELERRYHVPRSQVWGGSRGGQSGKVHLHVLGDFASGRLIRARGSALCGKNGWYERPPEGETELCPACVVIAERHGLVIPEAS